MARVSIGPSQGDAREILQSMPPGVRTTFLQGLRNLNDLSEPQLHSLFEALLVAVPDLEDVEPSELAPSCGVAEGLIGPVTLLFLILGVALSRFDGSLSEFMKLLTETTLIDLNVSSANRWFIENLYAHRTDISARMERQELADSILPSFLDALTEVDFRVKFKADSIEYGVPVLLLKLVTDSNDEDAVVQVSKGKLKSFIAELQKGLGKIEKLEQTWPDRTLRR